MARGISTERDVLLHIFELFSRLDLLSELPI